MLPDLPYVALLEAAGVLVSAASGAVAAVRKQFDVFGILVLAWVTGLGGGVLRDVLLGAVPPVGISDPWLVVAALAGGVLMYFGHPRLERARRTVVVLDAGALALFTAVGTLKGLTLDATPLAAIAVGVLTGVGGGVLRDLLTGEVPVVLHHRQLYAIPALVGATAMVVLWYADVTGPVVTAAVAAGVFGLRLVALRYRLSAPGPWRGGTR
ncbi:TRIC cation channel family protein [Cellulomonas sp.]|uniref:trimeric intracellular cation channel family protein n=1 Tax=Cellulomonas sp. TaxID=40001 RepID=UPI002811EEF1|nr:TRIC cation channel family protein [Cellulomonas sp.]